MGTGPLKQLGYGLALGKCGARGSTEDLIYVSPRTGCAVSATAGCRIDQLTDLPPFFTTKATNPSVKEIRTGLGITGHFLARAALKIQMLAICQGRAQDF